MKNVLLMFIFISLIMYQKVIGQFQLQKGKLEMKFINNEFIREELIRIGIISKLICVYFCVFRYVKVTAFTIIVLYYMLL